MGIEGWTGNRRLKSQIQNAGLERTGRQGWKEERGLISQIENAWEEDRGEVRGRWMEDGNLKLNAQGRSGWRDED